MAGGSIPRSGVWGKVRQGDVGVRPLGSPGWVRLIAPRILWVNYSAAGFSTFFFVPRIFLTESFCFDPSIPFSQTSSFM